MVLRGLAPTLVFLALAGDPTGPAASAFTVAESRVAASSDDAEEQQSGSVSIVGSDLELGWDGSPQTLGMRFPGLDVPQGALIHDAWIQFEADETSSTALTVAFQAEAADDAASFTTSNFSLTSRPRAAPTVQWTPAPWTSVGEAGPDQRSPDLSALVQAVVNRPGWVSGNALAIFVYDPSAGSTRRTARSWNTDASGAPLLHVEYELVDVNDPPTLEVLSPLPMAKFPAADAALVATASDPEDGDLGASILWTSSLDGIVGMGASLSPALSVGIHTLTAEVADGEGLTASVSLDVQVTAESYTVLAAGDIASCNSDLGDEATANLLDQRFGQVVTLGDNAYPDGTTENFMECYEPSWGRHKARTRPATGNHDYHVNGAADYFAYFGAAAGDPATGYYSFDLGSWHVVVLNSNCSEIGGCHYGDPQATWLAADLAANPSVCSIALTHHPRFSSGEKHGSDSDVADLYEIFHQHGGDLFLSSHDHNYERFARQDTNGNADPTGPVQFVVGTGGGNPRPLGAIEPNSVTSAGEIFGILSLTLRDEEYDWEFVPAAGYSYTDVGSANCSGSTQPPQNTPPEVSISTPSSGASFEIDTAITFSGSASDLEDGPLSNAINWISTRDGVIGNGPSFTTSALSLGLHTVKARVVDSGGLVSIAQVDLAITEPTSITIEKRIEQGSDDAEQEATGGQKMLLTSPDLEMVTDGDEQLVGMRFSDLAIPNGVRILEAWVQFQADGSTSSSTTLQIRAQASDDAPTFTSDRRDISDRPLGSASVSWTPSSWSSGSQGAAQRTPSLVPLVQEVVDRAGWASGNDLAIIISGSGQRRAESHDGISSAAPLLHVTYEVEGGGGPPPTGGCGLGPELVPALSALAWLRRWRRREPA